MKNILITGGAGYIGSHVANHLIDNGYNITIIDNLITGNKKIVPKEANLEICDIADISKVKNILENNNFYAVLHLAGLIKIDESIRYPQKYFEQNYEKAKIFLETCFDNNIKKIIFSSTAAVYGNPNKNKISETDNLNPLNPYASSKMKLENFLIDQAKQRQINYVILRYFNVAGADEKMRSGLMLKFSTHIIKSVCEVAIKKKDVFIINGNDYDTYDGTTIRDYIHVSDLSDIHLKSLEHLINEGNSEIFNCGYGKGYSVKEVVDSLNKIIQKKIQTKVGPRRDGDLKCVVANADKFNQFFSWKPKYNKLDYILKTALDWEKKIN